MRFGDNINAPTNKPATNTAESISQQSKDVESVENEKKQTTRKTKGDLNKTKNEIYATRQDKYGKLLDEKETITVTEKEAKAGKIHDFVPHKEYPIVLNYANTKSRHQEDTQVVAKRDKNKKTYLVVSGMKSRIGKRARIFPETQIRKVENVQHIPKSKADRVDIPIQLNKINGYIDSISRIRKTDSPLNANMIIQSSISTGVPLISPELMTAILQHETGLGIDCIKVRSLNTKKKKVRFSYYNVANIQYKNPKSWEEGVQQLADYLKRRYAEFKNTYPDKEPTIAQLLQNQGPNGKGFLSNQAFFKKPNPKAMGAYCANASKGEKVGDSTYPNTIAKTLKKIQQFSSSTT